MRLGLTPFPLSIRNSPIAVAHLIKKTNILQLFVSPDPAMQRLCREALEILKQDGIDVEVIPMIQFEVISDESAQAAELDKANVTLPKIDLNTTALILHSSGEGSQFHCFIRGECSVKRTFAPSLSLFTVVYNSSKCVVTDIFSKAQPLSPSRFPSPIASFCNGLSSHASVLRCCPIDKSLMRFSKYLVYGDVDVCGILLAVHTCPLFRKPYRSLFCDLLFINVF